MEAVTAIYEDGVLRLKKPLHLPNHTEVKVTIERSEPSGKDPVLELVGVFRSKYPLIDGIAVSEDPDLYIIAEAMGDDAFSQHAWEIAPGRYRRGQNDQPIRIQENSK